MQKTIPTTIQDLIGNFTFNGTMIRKSSYLSDNQVLPAADGGYFVSPKVFEQIQSLIPATYAPRNSRG